MLAATSTTVGSNNGAAPMTDTADIADAGEPARWLAACPVHAATPMRSLDALARELGWASLHAKDESGRMGLGSFKALGGAYAVMTLVRERLLLMGCDADEAALVASHRPDLGLTVCCASAGNHGLSVAAGAAVFGVACEVFLAASVPESFAERLREKGATVVRAGAIYEEAMAAARERARADGVTLVSDAAWEGEVRVPSLVMQGYAVMAEEIRDYFAASGTWPTHVALQAGVGGIAATVAAHIRRTWDEQPQITVVEPDRAPCLQASVEAGRLTHAPGAVSNMGRLDCKDASLVGFETLREAADRFVTVTDEEAEAAVQRLASHGLETSPSGAAGLAGMIAHAPHDARVLVLVTEGAIA